MTVTEDAPVQRAVIYPARVWLPNGTELRAVKVFVTQAAVYVYAGGPTGVTLAYAAYYTDAVLPPSTAPRSQPYVVTTEDGPLTARRLPGCGCGAAALKASRGPFADLARRLGA